ncbi:hypothetical protein ENBRE01_2287 [Enteropsectra breve]|nr:hypothetical protein ENBRE01_2287 [Enteropsectra breve]
MPNQFISNENRQRIIKAYLHGHTTAEIASFLGFKRTSVYSIIKNYKDNKGIERGVKRGVRRKILTNEQEQLIKSWIDDNCSLTLSQIKNRCENDLGIIVSKSTIDRCIGSFNYILKRVSAIPVRKNDVDTISIRAEYVSKFMQLLASNEESKIFFIDEARFNLSMRM